MDKIIAFFRRPQVWGFFLSVAVLAIVSLAFFYPDNFEGNSLQQADMRQGAANGHEGAEWEAATGEKALWANSLFSGMPAFQISPSYPSDSLFRWLNTVYSLGLPAPSNLLFMMMAGFLILMFALKFRWYYSLIGAIAWGFSSYFVIIIGAGHIWKFLALSYVPPTIAGILLLYRKRYLAGTAMTALFAMLQLNANHPQMSYYFGLVMLLIAIAALVEAVKRHEVKKWLIASGLALGAGALAVGANSPSLYNTYEYSKETKRSQSELTPLEGAGGPAATASRPTGGMPYEQIVGWSYGGPEMFSLLIPDIKGGATARPEKGQQTFMSLDRLPEAKDYEGAAGGALLPYLSQYFNDSEGTNGPVYVGALIMALFILGCFIVKGPLKWALLISTLVSILLALGSNMAWLTDLMIYHFPLYNKFRAVESILVVAEFCIPLLAMMALAKFMSSSKPMEEYRKPLLISFGIPLAICLFAALVPSAFGPAINSADIYAVDNIHSQILDMVQAQGGSKADADSMLYYYSLSNPDNVSAIEGLRYGMVRSDAWRSFFFLAAGGLLVFLFARGTVRRGVAVAALGVLVLADLYNVDKRYVSHDSFMATSAPLEASFVADDIDRAILADTTASYRVMDIPGFQSHERSYFHKTLGGYHAAKLNRYEDIIQRQLSKITAYGYIPELRSDSVREYYSSADPRKKAALDELAASYRVMDMLNAKYVITGEKDAPVLVNSHAMGNAWLVDSIVWVDGADSEMAALSATDLAKAAVADRRFEASLPLTKGMQADASDSIALTYYSPNTLKYRVDSRNGGIAVFSEVYFPWGWTATVNGVETPLARVDYVLRALAVPAGVSEVVMTFAPKSLEVCGTVAYACVTLIYLLVIGALFVETRRSKMI